jgi:hypothetical protein
MNDIRRNHFVVILVFSMVLLQGTRSSMARSRPFFRPGYTSASHLLVRYFGRRCLHCC